MRIQLITFLKTIHQVHLWVLFDATINSRLRDSQVRERETWEAGGWAKKEQRLLVFSQFGWFRVFVAPVISGPHTAGAELARAGGRASSRAI